MEFRLLTAPLPENEPAPTEETSPTAPPPEATPAKLKEVSLGLSQVLVVLSRGFAVRRFLWVFEVDVDFLLKCASSSPLVYVAYTKVCMHEAMYQVFQLVSAEFLARGDEKPRARTPCRE